MASLSAMVIAACVTTAPSDLAVDSQRQALEGSVAQVRKVTLIVPQLAPISEWPDDVYPPDPVPPELACEPAASPIALRSGCPEEPPGPSACDQEGLQCRYPTELRPSADLIGDSGELGDCVRHVECALGVWTEVGLECERSIGAMELLGGDGECPTFVPIADSPCEQEGIRCGLLCAFGGGHDPIVSCECGRWRISHDSCGSD